MQQHQMFLGLETMLLSQLGRRLLPSHLLTQFLELLLLTILDQLAQTLNQERTHQQCLATMFCFQTH